MPHGLYIPLLVVSTPWKDISMNFILGLSRTQRGFVSIFVVVDCYSKMTHFIPCHKVYDASNIARLFLRDVVKFLGIPHNIVFDGETLSFLATFGKSLVKARTKLNFFTSCQPQTDGQTEVVNRSLPTMLRAILKGNHKSWDECLHHIEFSNNRVVHRTTKISPFEAIYGFNPLTPMDLLPLPTSF